MTEKLTPKTKEEAIIDNIAGGSNKVNIKTRKEYFLNKLDAYISSMEQSGGGLSERAKKALMAVLRDVAYKDTNGDALCDELAEALGVVEDEE